MLHHQEKVIITLISKSNGHILSFPAVDCQLKRMSNEGVHSLEQPILRTIRFFFIITLQPNSRNGQDENKTYHVILG